MSAIGGLTSWSNPSAMQGFLTAWDRGVFDRRRTFEGQFCLSAGDMPGYEPLPSTTYIRMGPLLQLCTPLGLAAWEAWMFCRHQTDEGRLCFAGEAAYFFSPCPDVGWVARPRRGQRIPDRELAKVCTPQSIAAWQPSEMWG